LEILHLAAPCCLVPVTFTLDVTMCSALDFWSGAALMATLLLFCSGFVVYGRFLARLEREHPGEFRLLGSPTLVMAEGDKREIGMVAYLLGRQYTRLQDSSLTRMGNISLVLSGVSLLAFAGFLCFAAAADIHLPLLGIECFWRMAG